MKLQRILLALFNIRDSNYRIFAIGVKPWSQKMLLLANKKGQIHGIRFTRKSCDYKHVSKQFAELIFTTLFTVSVLLRVPIFCRYYADIGN